MLAGAAGVAWAGVAALGGISARKKEARMREAESGSQVDAAGEGPGDGVPGEGDTR